MDGASNKWIARKVIEILKIIKPKLIVIQWSYIHRDELNDSILSDEDRRMCILENNNINESTLLAQKNKKGFFIVKFF
jgi:predicted RNA-binding protein with EMAP domain